MRLEFLGRECEGKSMSLYSVEIDSLDERDMKLMS